MIDSGVVPASHPTGVSPHIRPGHHRRQAAAGNVKPAYRL